MVVNANHYRRMTMKQAFCVENTLLESGNLIDFPVQSPDLSAYDEIAEGAVIYE